MAEKVYKLAEIRSILGISKGSAYSLIHSGELEHFRIGRSIRVTDRALNQYIDTHTNRKEA